MTYRNAALIYNPYAGRLRGARVGLIKRIVDTLGAAGHRVSAMPTKAPGDATRLARECAASGADLVLAFGGDGTLNEAVNGLAHTETPVAMLPGGTANVFAREIGVAIDPLKAARVLGELTPRRIALGVLHAEPDYSRYFVLMAGVGFDAHIVYNLHLPLKARLGQFAYWVGAFREFGREQDEFRTTVAGHAYTCSFALASRTRNYAGWMSIAQRVKLIEDEFEVVLCEGTSTFRDYLRYFAAVMTGTAPNTKGMCFLRATEASFAAPPGACVYVQIDGEYAGRLPARVEIAPNALTVLAPPMPYELA